MGRCCFDSSLNFAKISSHKVLTPSSPASLQFFNSTPILVSITTSQETLVCESSFSKSETLLDPSSKRARFRPSRISMTLFFDSFSSARRSSTFTLRSSACTLGSLGAKLCAWRSWSCAPGKSSSSASKILALMRWQPTLLGLCSLSHWWWASASARSLRAAASSAELTVPASSTGAALETRIQPAVALASACCSKAASSLPSEGS
mmetsp:Transcript_11433/g.26432  ORF Transcript_11433/g.26432 Transcript_11433/m.26432 type:complete len:206 (-) Transcript_11433:1842-2459(-)